DLRISALATRQAVQADSQQSCRQGPASAGAAVEAGAAYLARPGGLSGCPAACNGARCVARQAMSALRACGFSPGFLLRLAPNAISGAIELRCARYLSGPSSRPST